MKKKEFNIKLSGLTLEELREMLNNTQTDLNKMRMSHRTAEIENPVEIRTVRRNVARILTEIKKENYKTLLINENMRNLRKERVGIVTSSKMDKSITVEVEEE